MTVSAAQVKAFDFMPEGKKALGPVYTYPLGWL